jgi:hypothetical protein
VSSDAVIGKLELLTTTRIIWRTEAPAEQVRAGR